MTDTVHVPRPALAIVNARAWTGDPRRPWADAVLVRGDRVAGVGSSAEIRKRAGVGAVVIDARGMLVSAESGEGAIATGAPADLIVVDRAAADSVAADGAIVFRLAQGKVVVDRHSWASRER